MMIQLQPLKPLCRGIQSSQGSFYIYQTEKYSERKTGLLCKISVEHLCNGNVVEHEMIYPEKIDRLYENLLVERKQRNPILLFTDDFTLESNINALLDRSELVMESTLPSGETHRVFCSHLLPDLVLDGTQALGIADGHHRIKALLRYYQLNREIPMISPTIMATLFSTKQLKTRAKGIIIDFSSTCQAVFFEKLRSRFDVRPTSVSKDPQDPFHFQMLLNNQWFALHLKPCFINEVSQVLGIEIFKEFILQQTCGIDTYTNNPCISVIFEECNISALKSKILDGKKIGFVVSSDPAEKILSLARIGKILEPNSTFFEPKFIEGLIEHPIGGYDH